MRHYLGIKSNHPDRLVFYHKGDFCELSYDDARRRSTPSALRTLFTKRDFESGHIPCV